MILTLPYSILLFYLGIPLTDCVKYFKACVYEDGSFCKYFVPEVNSRSQSASFARLLPTEMVNVTCVGSEPVRWVLQVKQTVRVLPVENRILLPASTYLNPVADYSQGISIANINGGNGVVRCVNSRNESEFAELIFDSGPVDAAPHFLDESKQLHFFIVNETEQPDRMFVVPCRSMACTGDVDHKCRALKSVRFLQANLTTSLGTEEASKWITRITASISESSQLPAPTQTELITTDSRGNGIDECIPCLCSPSGCKTTSCPDDVSTCGPFNMTYLYWQDALLYWAQKEVPFNGDWRDCADNYECSSKAVRHFLTHRGKDCDRDGRITCRDFILLHYFGSAGCYDPSPGFLEPFESCLRKLSPSVVMNCTGDVDHNCRTPKSFRLLPDNLTPTLGTEEAKQRMNRNTDSISGSSSFPARTQTELVTTDSRGNGIDECIPCLCSPSGCKTASCRDDMLTCGPFNMTYRYWQDATQKEVPFNGDWRECASNYECSSKAVRHFLTYRGKDCDRDGRITCRDFILIHYLGSVGCYDPSPGFLEPFESCLRKLSPSINHEESKRWNYDPARGLIVTGSINFTSVYACSSEGLVATYVPLDAHRRVRASIYLVHSDSNEEAGRNRIHCKVEDRLEEMQDFKLTLTSCSSLFECDVKYSALEELESLMKATDETAVPRWRNRLRRSSSSANEVITDPAGKAVCLGLRRDTASLLYVKEVDYYYTGLNSKVYLASEQPPQEALIQMKTVNSDSQAIATWRVTCRVSTFLHVQNVSFLCEYDNGTVSYLAGKVAESSAEAHPTNGLHFAEQELEVRLESGMRRIFCMAPSMHKSTWIKDWVTFESMQPMTSPRTAPGPPSPDKIPTVPPPPPEIYEGI